MAQTSVENFFRGQTVRIVVASGPAGGFDTFARLLARNLSRFVPGNPTFVVQNMPGAGGLRAAGYIAKVAPRDGLTIGAVQGGMVKAPHPRPDRRGLQFGQLALDRQSQQRGACLRRLAYLGHHQ